MSRSIVAGPAGLIAGRHWSRDLSDASWKAWFHFNIIYPLSACYKYICFFWIYSRLKIFDLEKQKPISLRKICPTIQDAIVGVHFVDSRVGGWYFVLHRMSSALNCLRSSLLDTRHKVACSHFDIVIHSITVSHHHHHMIMLFIHNSNMGYNLLWYCVNWTRYIDKSHASRKTYVCIYLYN